MAADPVKRVDKDAVAVAGKEAEAERAEERGHVEADSAEGPAGGGQRGHGIDEEAVARGSVEDEVALVHQDV